MTVRRASRGRTARLGLAVLLCAVGTVAAPARADVIIGVAVPRTGPVAGIGEQVLQGVQAAARDANARGGIAGEPIVLSVQDDGCDPGQAVEVAERFMQAQVRLIVGHVCSSASLAASDVYAANGAVMISPASNAARLTDRGLPTIFRVSGREDDQGRLSATILAERFRDKKIAILSDDTPLSRSLADSTKANLNKIGQNEALFATIVPGQTDDAALIKRLQAAGIEVVYYGGHYQEMGRLVRTAAEQGYRPQWFGTSGIATKEFGALAGPASNGVLMTFNPDLRRKPEAAAAVKAFQAEGVDPGGFTLYGYAALQALVEAGNFAKSTDPKTVAETLHAERFNLVLGNVGFDQKGDVTTPGYVLYVWRDGAFTYAN
ncbi:MAG: branched-chain amino acid ABC transporter substrate-binding protein [Methylobacterium sp.]|uniref:branched-chain amino acid ABC transporter substrate-binding protein n=1 Tax=Methylobacterium sp. TaxID=409 RepID=UPI00258B1867|nr:branched-chain amino acid ABC transporter substrate-binding protein [Methylobacterium sp.]MBY0299241.1 branched-chain amino acid ABC transporter substrate-binding protein [Methylobacterium sp.]